MIQLVALFKIISQRILYFQMFLKEMRAKKQSPLLLLKTIVVEILVKEHTNNKYNESV